MKRSHFLRHLLTGGAPIFSGICLLEGLKSTTVRELSSWVLHISQRRSLHVPFSANTFQKMEQMNASGYKDITRVLFCGSYFPAAHGYTREYLQKHPFIQVDDAPLADVPDVIANYHLCVVLNRRLDSNLISRASRMKVIMQFGVGLEGVDIDAATKCGIKVAKIPAVVTGNAASCAEMAIYLMLGLLRKQNELQISVKQRKLGEPIGDTLLGKTVFIMGYGNIGTELAKRLKPFGVKVIATKRNWPLNSQVSHHTNGSPIENGTPDDFIDEKGSHEDIYNFAGKADIVACCLLMNKETVGIINKKFISSMRKGSLLVNIARGGLLDYDAVVQHLESGHLGGLGTDVTWTEPFNPEDPLLKFNNVIITPHIAGVTEHSYRSMSKKKRQRNMCASGRSLPAEAHTKSTSAGLDLRAAFDVLDVDRDGKISKEDLQMVYPGFSSTSTAADDDDDDDDVIGSMMSIADCDQDGFVEYGDFERVVLGGSVKEEKSNGVMEDVFKVMDKDGDGKLSADDLKSYMQWAGLDASDDDIKAMIRLGGGDEDGLSFDDLLRILAIDHVGG